MINVIMEDQLDNDMDEFQWFGGTLVSIRRPIFSLDEQQRQFRETLFFLIIFGSAFRLAICWAGDICLSNIAFEV